MANLLALLIAFLALYSNPQIQKSPVALEQLNAMVPQISLIAKQAMSQPPETQLGTVSTSTAFSFTEPVLPSSTPITVQIYPPNQPVQAGIGAPDLASIVAPPEAACTLNVVQSSQWYRDGDFSWTYSGVPDAQAGQLYAGILVGVDGVPTNFEWRKIGAPLKASEKSFIGASVDFQIPGRDKFKLELGNATCFADYHPASCDFNMGCNPDGLHNVNNDSK